VRRFLSSTVARLVIAIFVLQLACGGIAMVLLHSQIVQVIAADRARQIFDVRDDLMAAYYEGGRQGLARYVADQRGSVGDPLIFVAIGPAGATGGAPLLSHIADMPDIPQTLRPVELRLRPAAGTDPVAGVAIADRLSDGSGLVVGTVTASDRSFNLAFAEAITLTVVLTAALSLVGAVLIGFFISRRTHAIAATAEALASGNFAARIAGDARGDGFDHLRQQINVMAEQIDRLVNQLQSVAGALAHDLRSPVARLKASIATASDAVEEGPALDALQLARADAEALESMLAAALELAKLETGAVGDRRQPLDLAELARDLVELYEPLAEQGGTALDCEGEALTVRADRELVSRCLANLIDNALKYGGNRIEVRVRKDGGWAMLEVSDNGPGIGAEDRARAIGRFTRLDNARTLPGAGLGLAMVDAVARLHGGRFELADAAGSGSGLGQGLVARLRLPLG